MKIYQKNTGESQPVWIGHGKEIDLSQPAVMGILNVTPDSFSDGGLYLDKSSAVDRALKMAEEGAAIIDIGGESSRPGAEEVPLEEELNRVIPVIKEIRRRSDIPISIDTYKPMVAREALEYGADIINDITGFTNPEMLDIASDSNAGIVIMHKQGTPRTMQENPSYKDVVAEIKEFLYKQAQKAMEAGVVNESIVIDPGIGFGKTVQHNYRILRELKRFTEFNLPVLIGISRKSLIGAITGLPVDERLAPSIALNVFAAMQGVHILRVHDVKETIAALKVLNVLLNDHEGE